MGIEYSIVNYRTKKLFDLGKGPWSDFINHPELVYDRCNLVDYFEDIDYDWEQYGGEEISSFVEGEGLENIVVIHDMGDALPIVMSYKYRYIQTRYYKNNAEEKQKYLEMLNHHLTPAGIEAYNNDYSREEIIAAGLDPDKL